jgi:hypothetical protein
MRFRTDFVTNSSSSSFVCEICNEAEGGYDLSISDTHFLMCEAGHTFCIGHLSNAEIESFCEKIIKDNSFNNNYSEMISTLLEEYKNIEGNYYEDDIIVELSSREFLDRYNWPSEFCPICKKRLIPDYELLEFLLISYDLEKDMVSSKNTKKNGIILEETNLYKLEDLENKEEEIILTPKI